MLLAVSATGGGVRFISLERVFRMGDQSRLGRLTQSSAFLTSYEPDLTKNPGDGSFGRKPFAALTMSTVAKDVPDHPNTHHGRHEVANNAQGGVTKQKRSDPGGDDHG